MTDQYDKYVGAPYNFVPFSDKVIEYRREDIPKYNDADKNLYTGEIEYSVVARTPIIVDSGNDTFFKDVYGRFAIPGSTMRGLVRNNAQIMSLSSFDDDIDDYLLMYRNVANGAEKGRYNTILGNKQILIQNGTKSDNVSVLVNVKAGYIKNTEGNYEIFRVKPSGGSHKEMNYYILSEKNIANDYKKCKESSGYKFSFPFAFIDGSGRETPENCRLQHLFWKGFKKENRNGRDHYIGQKNNEYIPYNIPCSYETSGENVTALGKPGLFKKSGYAVSTGKMNEKKAIYIIPEPDFDNESITVPEKDIESFKIDFNRRKNTLKTFGGEKCFDLPEDGKFRPVFYIEYGGRLYFGFTPRLRLFYDHTIKDGMPEAQRGDCIDYAKALFGFSKNNDSFKTRVSFSDAVIDIQADPLPEKRLVLGEPKPTSYMDYLEAVDGNPTTYNSDSMRLRGIKQYWLQEDSEYDRPSSPDIKENVCSKINPLPAGTKFSGKVRFRNLKKDELGLLLWAVRIEKDSEVNIGKAKSYGFGNAKIEIKTAKVLDHHAAYETDALSLDPYQEIDPNDFIRHYINYIRQSGNGIDLRKDISIKTFIKMKDPVIKPEKSELKFMDLKLDYQSRKTPLPSADELFVKKEINKDQALEGNKTLYGIVTKVEGKKVRFKVDEMDGIYGFVTCDDITFKKVTKEELKSLFPVGCSINVEYLGKNDDKDMWKCVGIN